MHPSWRDLVIEHVAADPESRRAFLRATELPGLELALSTGGGSAGERELPLLVDDEDWDALGDAVHRLCREAPQAELARLLGALKTALGSTRDDRERRELAGIAETALDTIRRAMDRSEAVWDAGLLEVWLALQRALPDAEPPLPSLRRTLSELEPADADPRDLESVARLDAYLAIAEAAGLGIGEVGPVLTRFVTRARQGAYVAGVVDDTLERIARLVPSLRGEVRDVLRERRVVMRDAEPASWEVSPIRLGEAPEQRIRRILRDL